MSKEKLTLTEAIRSFSEKKSKNVAEQLHEIFPESEYLIPVFSKTGDEAEVTEKLKTFSSIPVLIVKHPQVGNYIPVFTCEETAKKAKLPSNAVFAKVDFPVLVNLLKRIGKEAEILVFDPSDTGVVFAKDKFLGYADDLIRHNPELAIKPASLPKGKAESIEDGSRLLSKNVIRELKRKARNDSRIENVWLVRQNYTNQPSVWTLVVESENPKDALLTHYALEVAPHLLKKDIFNPCFKSESCEGLIENIKPFYSIKA